MAKYDVSLPARPRLKDYEDEGARLGAFLSEHIAAFYADPNFDEAAADRLIERLAADVDRVAADVKAVMDSGVHETTEFRTAALKVMATKLTEIGL